MRTETTADLIEQFEPDTEQALLVAVERLLKAGVPKDRVFQELRILE